MMDSVVMASSVRIQMNVQTHLSATRMQCVTTTTVATLVNASTDTVVMALPVVMALLVVMALSVVILTNATKEHTLVTQMLLVLTMKEVLIAIATQDTPAMAITVLTTMNV